MAAPEQRQSAELAGRRFAWRTLGGGGRPLLLINGYAACAEDWDPRMLALLARSFRVICPDNRGIGDSGLGDPDALTIDAMASDLEGLLDVLEIERLPIVGWSMGGYVAQRLATRAPTRVKAMVLLASDAGGPGAISAEPRSWRLLTDHSGSPCEQATRLIALLFPPTVAPEIDRQFGEIVAAARARLSTRTLDAQERALLAWHAEEQAPVGEHPPPVLIACGAEDAVIPPANADALGARWPGAQVERFAGCGHAFMAQEPERVASMIEGFLT
jgi:pimeloyl-ACP methyl ester carboxylesterase